MSQEFIKELERLKAKQAEQGGFNTPAPVAPGMQPQAPQELSTPEFGPTLANEAQLPVEQRTQDGTMIGVPDFNEPYIIPEAAQAFGDVPVVEKPSMIDSAIQGFKDQNERMAQSSYSPMGGVSTPSTAVKNVSGFGGAVEEIGGEALGNLSDEAIMNRMAVSQGKPIATPSATPSATPAATPAMDGSQIPQAGEKGFKFAERGSPQDYFLLNTNDGTTALSPEQITRGQEYAKQQGLNFDPTTGFSQSGKAPQVQAPQGLTTAGGQPLAEFLAGNDAAPSQQLDAQGRMIDPNVDRSSFEKESAAREARQAARPDFGEAQTRAAGTVTDRERRAARGDDMSDADRRDIAKANQRGASASDIARGDKVAALNGIDRKTGKPLEGVSGKELAETGKIRAETAKILSEIGEKSTELDLSPAEQSRDKTAGTALAKWDDSGRATVTSNITSLDSIVKGLEDGQIKTRGFIDALPFASDWARAIVNPKAQDAKNRVEGVIFQTLKETLGAQFTEKEGKRLVEASYNPMLSPEANAARLRDYSNGLKRAAAARESQMAYLKENKTLQGYDGATPEGIMSQVGAGEGGAGEGGSPIKGDVNYRSATQSKADQILSAQ